MSKMNKEQKQYATLRREEQFKGQQIAKHFSGSASIYANQKPNSRYKLDVKITVSGK